MPLWAFKPLAVVEVLSESVVTPDAGPRHLTQVFPELPILLLLLELPLS
jgi:hypothetical protein